MAMASVFFISGKAELLLFLYFLDRNVNVLSNFAV